MTQPTRRALIIGAGIGGLGAAVALRRVGWNVLVYESRPVVAEIGAGLLVGANALQALDRLGLASRIMQAARVLKALDILSADGTLLSRTSSRPANAQGFPDNITILRSDLLAILADAFGRDAIQTNKACTRVVETTNGVHAYFDDGTEARGDILIAADGIRSTIRQQLLPHGKLRYAGYTCWRGVIPADPDLRYAPEAATETWGTGARFGVVPLAGGKIYWYACLNARPDDPRHSTATANDLLTYFGDYHEPVPELLKRTGDTPLIWRDIYDLPPLRRFTFGRVALLGDAAHATTPNLGQGAAQALEDAVVLAAALRDNPDVVTALKRYERLRVPRTARVTMMSRRVGGMGQWAHPWLVSLRDRLLPCMPSRITQVQFDYLHAVRLPDLDRNLP